MTLSLDDCGDTYDDGDGGPLSVCGKPSNHVRSSRPTYTDHADWLTGARWPATDRERHGNPFTYRPNAPRSSRP